jgi:hypothetical protein
MRPPADDPRLGLCVGCGEYFELIALYLIFGPIAAIEKRKGRLELHHCESCLKNKLKEPLETIRLDQGSTKGRKA